MITTQGLERLPFVKDVNLAVDLLFHDWEIAAVKAIMTFEVTPDDNHSDLQFWVAFAGNMLWAVTIFVQPEVGLAVEAAALAAKRALAIQKAGSMIGAAAASNIAGKLLWSNPPKNLNSAEAKRVILTQITQLKGLLMGSIKRLTPRWATTGDGLVGSLVEEAAAYLNRTSPDFRSRMTKLYARKSRAVPARPSYQDGAELLTDEEFANWYNGNDGGGGDEILKSYVWKTFFDPGKKTSYRDRSDGLLNYFIDLFNGVEEEFEAALEIYSDTEDQYLDRLDASDVGRSKHAEMYEKSHAFQFKPYFGIPAS